MQTTATPEQDAAFAELVQHAKDVRVIDQTEWAGADVMERAFDGLNSEEQLELTIAALRCSWPLDDYDERAGLFIEAAVGAALATADREGR